LGGNAERIQISGEKKRQLVEESCGVEEEDLVEVNDKGSQGNISLGPLPKRRRPAFVPPIHPVRVVIGTFCFANSEYFFIIPLYYVSDSDPVKIKNLKSAVSTTSALMSSNFSSTSMKNISKIPGGCCRDRVPWLRTYQPLNSKP
jgi:hypothetical protein